MRRAAGSPQKRGFCADQFLPAWDPTERRTPPERGCHPLASAAAKRHPLFPGGTPSESRTATPTAQAAVTYAPQTISNPPTQAQVPALNDGLVAAITLLNELQPAAVEKGLREGSVSVRTNDGTGAVSPLRIFTGSTQRAELAYTYAADTWYIHTYDVKIDVQTSTA